MSPEHPKDNNHTPGGSVVLIVGPGDRFLSGVSYITAMHMSALPLIGTVHADQYAWAHAAERYAVLLGRVAGWGGGLSPRNRALDGNLAGGIA